MENSALRFERTRTTTDPAWRTAWELYTTAFPDHELRREEEYAAALADERFHAETVWEGDRFVGLCYWWLSEEGFAYLEHLAVVPAERGRSYGARILADLCDRTEEVILEIDPPVDEISRRRRGFYERCGFHYNEYDYLHPSYKRPFRPHRLMVMSRPTPLAPSAFERFAEFIRGEVMRYGEK